MLESKPRKPEDERSTSARPLTTEEAAALLTSVETVLIARGRKLEEHSATRVVPTDLLGPTGKFRAPMVVVDQTLLVGFHAETLEALLTSS